ncbi:Mss4-like protein [Fusarium flagelliforme]|uniref:Mss4-like protein n=1 Tax=Fusarium flagelliforme TaxID=2675880 RepID=UPI001E8E4EF7|nr:Mss4-like protein [Fusarium flagelliforme]KAH7173144.1 Mss4-like protein [Fusarium flagelliforme]
MSSGHCLCGGVKVEVSGDPVAVVLCHCLDCRKTSGSTHGLNWVVPGDLVQLKGPSKTFTKLSKAGNPVTNTFCPTCGTTMFRYGPAAPGIKFVKAGIFDDPELLATIKPQGEIFVSRRPVWMSSIEGASQKKEMVE